MPLTVEISGAPVVVRGATEVDGRPGVVSSRADGAVLSVMSCTLDRAVVTSAIAAIDDVGSRAPALPRGIRRRHVLSG